VNWYCPDNSGACRTRLLEPGVWKRLWRGHCTQISE